MIKQLPITVLHRMNIYQWEVAMKYLKATNIIISTQQRQPFNGPLSNKSNNSHLLMSCARNLSLKHEF